MEQNKNNQNYAITKNAIKRIVYYLTLVTD